MLKDIKFYSTREYDGIDSNVIFPAVRMKNMLGDVLEANNLTQIRAAETEKYAHVTFFIDGGVDKEHEGKLKILVPSPKVATYDLQPEMSAIPLTDNILDKISEYDVAIINFANTDMVGHTGDLDATIKSVEVVDEQIGRIYDKVVTELGGVMIITADHGNADKMVEENGNPHTRHTVSPVPFLIVSKDVSIKPEMRDIINGKLGDIAPTILALLDIEKPAEMTGISLIEKEN
jgi:2,3-bisphosphoglycerate-independent phosphoglycerate mutase